MFEGSSLKRPSTADAVDPPAVKRRTAVVATMTSPSADSTGTQTEWKQSTRSTGMNLVKLKI